ncbi:MAG: HEAT repeat domain-containing protein [bacterium]|nr:HEAT repeat domain-containing protein [bacterium]
MRQLKYSLVFFVIVFISFSILANSYKDERNPNTKNEDLSAGDPDDVYEAANQIEQACVQYQDSQQLPWDAVQYLQRIFRDQGREAVLPAVPALNRLLDMLLDMLFDKMTEEGAIPDEEGCGEGESCLQMLNFLVEIGDERSIPIFLKCALYSPLGSPAVSRALVCMGETVLPAVIAAAEDTVSKSYYARRMTAAYLLGKMLGGGKINKLEDKDRIRQLLITLAGEEGKRGSSVRSSAVTALSYFKDQEVIALLKRIANEDPDEFYVRSAARRALKKMGVEE